MTRVILDVMKTAISIPDPLFEAAEALARRLGISRSDLYARAVSEYLDQREAERVSAALDRVYRHQPSSLDPALARLQSASLPKDEW